MKGVWRLKTGGGREMFLTRESATKMSEQVFSTFSSHCFGVISVYNYVPRDGNHKERKSIS
jgi:hypothetical protein